MALPTPERGLMISYDYLWNGEHERGRDVGIKNRPCVIILAVEDDEGECLVTVAPVTPSQPTPVQPWKSRKRPNGVSGLMKTASGWW